MDGPLERPRAVVGGVALFRQQLLGRGSDLQGDSLLLQLPAQLFQLQLHDRLEILSGELVEDDDLIQSIQKFRPEGPFYFIQDPASDLLVGQSRVPARRAVAEPHRSPLAQ